MGCGLPRRGYRAATPPATLEPKAQRRLRPARASTLGVHICIPPHVPLKAARERVSDRNGSADATPQGGLAEASTKVERDQAARPETPFLSRLRYRAGTPIHTYGVIRQSGRRRIRVPSVSA
ncbi:hypothetical protein GGR39_003274 [Novosphingobium fluoreni]|uniref:Uncharacterized protein n=1 Tax=Novosphingobium fluoreni TaxID=1391222 RepID=A0A7W6C674_9SPHN|nr:hypothetical protein [Novosphingobium fluoreni]